MKFISRRALAPEVALLTSSRPYALADEQVVFFHKHFNSEFIFRNFGELGGTRSSSWQKAGFSWNSGEVRVHFRNSAELQLGIIATRRNSEFERGTPSSQSSACRASVIVRKDRTRSRPCSAIPSLISILLSRRYSEHDGYSAFSFTTYRRSLCT